MPLAPQLVSALKAWKLACPISEAGFGVSEQPGKVEHHINLLRELETVMRNAGVVERATGKPKYACMRSAISSPRGASTQRNAAAANCRPRWCRLGSGIRPSS